MALSKEEFDKLKYRLGGSPAGSIAPTADQSMEAPASPGFFDRVGADFKENTRKLSESAASTRKDIADAGGGLGANILGIAQQTGNTAGAVAKGAFDVAKEGVVSAINTINQDQGQTLAAAGDSFKKAKNIFGQTNEETLSRIGQIAKTATDNIPDMPENVRQSFENLMSTLALTGAGKAANAPLEGVIAGTVSKAKGAATAAKDTVAGLEQTVKRTTAAIAEKAKSPLPSVPEAAGQIVQGKTKDIVPALKSIASVDVADVKTFKDLASKFDDKIGELAAKVDSDLGLDTTRKSLSDLVVNAKTASGKAVVMNPVDDALKQLDELYTTTGDKVSAANIKEIMAAAKADGLTSLEVNDIARKYGREFGTKAFGKTGEPLTSVNAQLYENTRKGLKSVARSGIKGSEAKAADELMSSIYNTQNLVKKNVEAVNRLKQRIQERGILEKAGHMASKYADILTGGSIRGLIGGLLPRGAGYKVMNALDLEEALSKNLQIIKKAAGSGSEKEILDALKSLVGGAGKKP